MPKDQKFISIASSSGDWEVKTGQVAETKAQSPAVKQLAARLVTDHTRSNAELLELAKKKGLSISQGVKAQQINGENYDQHYLGLVEKDNQDEIAAFSKEAQSGDDPEIKAWARKMLPTLKQHLSEAKQASPKQ